MLKLTSISNIEIHTDRWRIARLAKLTSSMIYTIMGDKFLTVDCVNYIYEKVGEEVSGVPANYEVDTWETRWGLTNEGDAIKKFMATRGIEIVVTQKLITEPGSRFGSTPDFIFPIAKYNDKWDVETGEVKCYPSYPHFIRCVLCNTPAELKAVDKKLYWQTMDQMDNCDAMRGNAVLYHPDFKVGGFKIIPFRKIDLTDDFKLLRERKRMASDKFDEFREKLMNIG